MSRPLIAVVDHGAGNIVSISRGLERAGASVRLAVTPDELENADGIVLPGVGATASVMDGIRAGGFEDALKENSLPLFGICVGMQVLFEGSTEDGATGLGLIAGTVERLDNPPTLPHIGWNEIETFPDPLFDGLAPAPEVYFVHSYAPVSKDPGVVIARATHGDSFVAAVRSGLISGTQFHPERSGEIGLSILRNFVASTVRAPA
jgi:imidazole glycerol-phosphate synthase subunit HisH